MYREDWDKSEDIVLNHATESVVRLTHIEDDSSRMVDSKYVSCWN